VDPAATDPSAGAPSGTPGREPVRRIPLPWLLVPIGVMSVAGLVADALAPALITRSPVLQLFLNPRNRYLLLVAPQVDPLPFFVVGFVRLLLTDPLYFLLGRQYGEAALQWAEDNAGPFVRTVERWFGKAAPLVVLIAPSGNMCLLAGAAGMRVKLFWTMNVVGTVGRLTLFWLVSDALRHPLEDLLDFIQRYQWRLLALSVVLVVVQATFARRRGSLDTPAEAESEIEEHLHEMPPPDERGDS
jgi:membrane protein DedA with SNARE-associated domain